MDTFRSMYLASFLLAALMASSSVFAQQSSAGPAAAVSSGSAGGSVVPHLVNYGGTLQDTSGKPVTAIRGITFFLYRDAQGGAPIWMETQNVTPDKSGHYTVQLGATRSQGLPPEMFISGAARWLAVQVSGEAEQPRVLLVSAPYAMKAADAETIGGLPPSAFVLAAPLIAPPVASGIAVAGPAATPINPAVTGVGVAGSIPLWDSASDITSSAIVQTGSGSTARIGINTNPSTTFDVKGTSNFRGTTTIPSAGLATASAGKSSYPFVFATSAYNSGTKASVLENFRWQAEPVGNNSASPSGSLNLLFSFGTATPAETGLSIASNGRITFATGQAFPGTGTVTSVGLSAPSSDFTVSGSPVTSSGNFGLAWKTAPTSADTANAIVKRDATGSFSVTNILGTGEFYTISPYSNAISAYTSSDGGTTIMGTNTAIGGSHPAYGVTGNSQSKVAGSTGVLGEDFNLTDTGGFTIGVQGVSYNPSGMGVLGFAGSNLSSVFLYSPGTGAAGVWGDGGSVRGSGVSNTAVIGTTDDASAGFFANNSPSGMITLQAQALGSNSLPFVALNVATGKYCNIDNNGNLNCSGTKNAVVPIYGGKRTVAMSAIESPQNWFEDAGSAELVNGSAVVALDPDFIQTVNTALDYKVFPVPNADCKGLYVTNKTATSFEVRELGGGTASIRFDYRIMALRRNYEKVRFADHTNDPDPRQKMEEMKQRRKNAQQTTAAQADPASSRPSPLPRAATSQ